MIKAQASFIKNTIDPLVDKIQDLLWFTETKGYKYEDFREAVKKAFMMQIAIEVIRGIVNITCLALVCITVWRIY